MIRTIRSIFKKLVGSRILVLGLVFFVMFGVIVLRLFNLQILQGASYEESFSDLIHKEISISATRGNIYDVNGNLLAYNELAYSVTISDTGSYSSTDEKNEQLNAELAEILNVLHLHNESVYNSFNIRMNSDGSFSYTVSGSSLRRFLADIFGCSSYADLGYNESLGCDEKDANAAQIIAYLENEDHYDVSSSYDAQTAFEIVVIRHALADNYYSRYKTTTIAENVGEATIAYINEHSDTLTGTSIEESTIRKYNDSVYFASLLGYTGRISTEEYDTLHTEDSSYSVNDVVGKSGLEQYYESYLRGKNGSKEVYTNNLGKITEVLSTTDPTAGNDLYISIDKDLQIAAYKLLEQEIAGIVYSYIVSGDIDITDVYFALIDNNVVDISEFDDDDASDIEKAIYEKFQLQQDAALADVESQLSDNPTTLNDMSDQTLDYFTYIIQFLKDENILITSAIDSSDETYLKWRAGNLSPKDYLNYCISQQWIDISVLDVSSEYAQSSEIYSALCDFLRQNLISDKEFSKLVYQYMIARGEVTGRELCMILLQQGSVDYDENEYAGLSSGSLSPYQFLLDKINNIEITPAQLALDPCTGSCVITDPDTGEIKALVSYPGYDNNKLANSVDADYYEALQEDNSNPLWNCATQEKTAPGSTFKMVTATAGLAEDVISTESVIECTGKFLEVDNEPECWIYPQTHGFDNVSDALRDSCNIFFYTLGYKFATNTPSGLYSDSTGISTIQKYASLYGLDSKTGIEISESTPEIATEYPVMAAIGQSNNNLTTISLSRYVTAVTSGNLYTYQLMSKIVDKDGNVLESYEPEYSTVNDVLSQSEWDAIHLGMREVCESLDSFNGFDIPVAGKTGTAQQVADRPNHALFVGYAPYDDPQITIAVRIAYGYSSHNAAAAARNIFSYYFGEQTLDEILSTKASGVNTNMSSAFGD